MWILIVLILLCFVFYRIHLPLQYWKNKGVPHPTPYLIFGNLAPIIFKKEAFNEFFRRICTQFKEHRYFGFYQFSKPTIVLLDTELIKQIFIKNFEHFIDRPDFLPKNVDTFWKKGLFARKMKAMFQLVSDCSERFVDHFVKQNTTITLDILDSFTRFDIDVITSCTFGVHCDSLKNRNNEFYSIAKEAFDFTGLKALTFFGNAVSPWLSKLFVVTMFSKKVTNFFIGITKETIAYRTKTGLHQPDVIHLLMKAQKDRLMHNENKLLSSLARIDQLHNQEKNTSKKLEITDEDIASQVLVFFFGSYDTVSPAICHTIYELVANLDVQEKLKVEIDFTLNSCNGKITYEALFGMKYLDMVISESLRFWPPPPALNRICVKPFIIEPMLPNEKSFTIERGNVITLSPFAFHRNSKYFPNPDKFDPERFNDKNKNNIKPYTYFPFGIGPRRCIGNRFALMVMKLIIVNLLAHFEIIPVEKTVIPMAQCKDDTVIRSAHGYWFGLKPRLQCRKED